MKDKFPKNIDWPEAEHRDLDPLLVSLGHFAPREGFADAVMARIRIPEQMPATRSSWSLDRRRVWGLLAGYSVASAVSAALLIGLIMSGTVPVAAASATLVATWQAVQALAGELVAALPVFSSVDAFLSVLPALAAAAAVGWVVTMVSAVGLYRIMNSYNIQRTPVNAIR